MDQVLIGIQIGMSVFFFGSIVWAVRWSVR